MISQGFERFRKVSPIEQVAAARPPGRPQGRSPGRRSVRVYEDLQRDIMLGAIAPLDPLRELEVAQRFDCSQSTAREALIALDHDGLVSRRAHSGTFVADCRAGDARELIQIRRDIECRAVSRSIHRYGERLAATLGEVIVKMAGAARAGDAYQLSLHDREFHLVLFDAGGLLTVRPILRRCLIHDHRFKILNAKNVHDLGETAGRHEAILDALSHGDEAAARKVVSHHISIVSETASDVPNGMFQSGAGKG